MRTNPIHVGQTELKANPKEVAGDFVVLDGEDYYKISNYDQMRPFFIGVVSHSDHWLYISSSGGLSAGRKNPENALFPYYTDDKIHDSGELTGSKTIFLVESGNKTFLWEPFSDRYNGVYQIERNLYKNIVGNRLLFEEINHDLSLSFAYNWGFSQQYGFIKKCQLHNLGTEPLKIRLLDGMQNLLPYGVELKMQTQSSTLLDAYKKNELLEDSGLGLFLLSSVPVDKAEPSEALKATTVWQTGLEVDTHLLSSLQLMNFKKGLPLEAKTDVRAERGAYFVESTVELNSNEHKTWYFAAEINQGPSAVAALDQWIQKNEGLAAALEEDMKAGTLRLKQIVAAADGLQKSADRKINARHFANVVYNVMRGGIFDHNYEIRKKDLLASVQHFNHQVIERNAAFFQELPDTIHAQDLWVAATKSGDAQLQRLCLEYLPLTFSRRHGDPSRPWNHFSIELEDEMGEKKLYYQGNWRDIFQNWEALALSYPLFLEGMISKFVSASTADGYNPYRITRDGIDWEVIEEDDPWSYIGYWGDHQIIYLLKLLELSKLHHPGELERMLTQRLFAYANVPYRIRSYEALLADPQDTIDFNHELEAEVTKNVQTIGADGKLMLDKEGQVYLVNLTEKLLVSLLAKLSNFIPEGGIWLNTQRPEWNDANNALVGSGVSMVTLYYIRRFVTFCQSLFAGLDTQSVEVSEEVASLFQSISATFERYQPLLSGPLNDGQRRKILDELGMAGEAYRNKIYQGFSEKVSSIQLDELGAFLANVLAFTDHSIQANQRPDKLYHSYNLMRVEADGGISIRRLYEMLEGQVAVLSSGLLKADEAVDVLKALRNSTLYRADQHSYILYPDRQLPRFEVKNNIPEAAVKESALLTAMVAKGDRRLIEKDIIGQYHFNGEFHNQKDLEEALSYISTEEYGDLITQEKEQLLATFESVFDHQSFTGRSGTFFGYEGLGCIYWHMVSKLLLATEENYLQALNNGAAKAEVEQLIGLYYDVRGGIGFNKGPENYGAFPSDAYSHTPGNAGAQQPGMTGQVKEDILSRFGELGVFIESGQINFKPSLLRKEEFMTDAYTFTYYDLEGSEKELSLSADSLVFTYCQVPVVYQLGGKSGVRIYEGENGNVTEFTDLTIGLEQSRSILSRSGAITRVEVGLEHSHILNN